MNILLIPGLGNGLETWNWRMADPVLNEKLNKLFILPEGPTIEELLNDRFTTYSFTPPSFNKEFTILDYINWIRNVVFDNLIDPATGIRKKIPKPFYILAHSIGCIVAAKYTELYPNEVIKLFLIDPTPPYILNNLTYTKLNTTATYVTMFKLIKEWHYPLEKTYVLFNTQESDIGKDEQIKYIYSTFLSENIVQVMNQTHFVHITNPRLVNKFIFSKI
jgi:pimeloyl-ACP methyl ester carboxylesterase